MFVAWKYEVGGIRSCMSPPLNDTNAPTGVNDKYLPYAIAGAPAAIGCAMGILVGGKLREQQRGTAATLMLGVAVLAAAPFAVDYVKRRIAVGGVEKRSQKRLTMIRDGAVPVEDDIYGSGLIEDEIVTF